MNKRIEELAEQASPFRELHHYLFHFLDKYSFWCYTN